MQAPDPDAAGFAPEWDQPVRYIERTHRWYSALGYGNPYRYAQFNEVPFAPLKRPLAQSRVALITTAAPYQPDKGDQTVHAPYNAAAKFYSVYSGDSTLDHDLRIAHVGIDRIHLADDPRIWFPLATMRQAAQSGLIGALADSFHGVPTNRSQRHTIAVDCPEVLARLRADDADAAVLVANCPICHQTLSLVARHLERAGITTVLMGAARDIVELCGVPRFLFSDFPLGAAAGRPFDPASQRQTLELALKLLETAPAPRTTVQNPLRWNGVPQWRLDYMNIERLDEAQLRALRESNDRAKAVAKALREGQIGTPASSQTPLP